MENMGKGVVLLPCVSMSRIFLPGQKGRFMVIFKDDDAPLYRMLLDCYQQKKSVVLIVPDGGSETRFNTFGAVAMLQNMVPAQMVIGEEMQFYFKAIGRCQLLGFSKNSENCRLAKVMILPVPEIDETAWQSDDMRALRDDILTLFKDVAESYATLSWEEIDAVAETSDALRENVRTMKEFTLRTQMTVMKLASEPRLSYEKYYRAVAVRWMVSVDDDYVKRFLEANDVKEQLIMILIILDDFLRVFAEMDDMFKRMIAAASSNAPSDTKFPAVLAKGGKPPQKKSKKEILDGLLAKLDAYDKRLVAILGKITRKEGDDNHG